MSTREKQLIKRELGTELAVYHDFIRRRLQNESKGPLYRRKRGIAFLRTPYSDQNDDDDDDNAIHQPASQRTSSSSKQQQSMRVNVIRKLHAQHANQQTSSMPPTPQPQHGLKRPPIDISPIGSALSTPHKVSALPTSTPFDSGNRVILNPHSKRVTFSEDSNKGKTVGADRSNSSIQHDKNNAEMACGSNEDYTGLSTVQLVESDYLHFMSNLFAFVCQNE